ncbi:HCP-like protein [Lindgomyces ingoldianus]|uniref:HCP-like protein n=1 Tax=Lindgomyces ingoldianus TaxID=673940 RepID=A0ACB6QM91_9PLEO|nr:HCP-like protein [Lindgomyces ingoldianus]KAF2468139.1 HCP-like protein [Lindgomyces ingoldianus]
MPLKDLLKKKDKVREEGPIQSAPTRPTLSPDVPEFTFMRTTTTTQEVITPPSFPGDPTRDQPLLSPEPQKRLGRFRRHSNASSQGNSGSEDNRAKGEHRLSERLHLGRARSSSSVNVPENLPDLGDGVARTEDDEAKWEKRATLLAKGNSLNKSGSTTPNYETSNPIEGNGRRSRSVSVSNVVGDDNIQEAIRLHESGNLEASTAMFGKLADPNGPNNALSQVLYGLALRHGWGCEPNVELAITYLSYAASNSAEVESLALGAGMKKGGAAKGELVLAMYELANCFRNGWGIKKDAVAAKQYYETAANLGDTDAMNEVAWCYLEGFGCKKDKVSQPFLHVLLYFHFDSRILHSLISWASMFLTRLTMECYASQFKAAQFLRLAEEKGSKTLGNTW